MKQHDAPARRRIAPWFLISCALWLALTVALQFAGGGVQPASAQQNGPQPTTTVEATNTPGPTPDVCTYAP